MFLPGKIMKFAILICIGTFLTGFAASAQTSTSGQAVSVATPTPGPVGTASTALSSSLTGGGVVNGRGTMGAGISVPPPSAVGPIVPGAVVINSNGSSVGTGNLAGSSVINGGGPGTVTGAPTPTSTVPTYVVPGSGLGTVVLVSGTALVNGTATVTVTAVPAPNPNPGSVQ
jgi:hypothetical protein